MDVAGDIYSKRWSLSGNVSWYRAGNTALRLNSAEGSVNGSLFLTWHPSHGPKLSAGVTNYSYQADFFDYNGAEQSRLIRYQLALDFSPVLASAWFDKETQLTMLASFQGSKTGSQWSQVGYNSDEGNLFVGLKLARPFLY